MAYGGGKLDERAPGLPENVRAPGPAISKALEVRRGPATDKIFVKGLPDSIGEDVVKACFEAYGAVKSVQVIGGENCAFVQYDRFDDAEDALVDPNGITLSGQKLVLRRAIPNPDFQETKALPKQDDGPGDLEFLAIRGSCTSSAIGTCYRAACAGTATYVVWDHYHKPAGSSLLSRILRTEQFDWDEAELADVAMNDRLMECLPPTPGRRAVMSFVSDRLCTDATLGELPLYNCDGILANVGENHTHQMKLLNIMHAYQPWVHKSQAAMFIVIPKMLAPWCADLSMASVCVHRLIHLASLSHNDCGWVIGLQITADEGPETAQCVYSGTKGIMNADDATRSMMAGSTISLQGSASGVA